MLFELLLFCYDMNDRKVEELLPINDVPDDEEVNDDRNPDHLADAAPGIGLFQVVDDVEQVRRIEIAVTVVTGPELRWLRWRLVGWDFSDGHYENNQLDFRRRALRRKSVLSPFSHLCGHFLQRRMNRK